MHLVYITKEGTYLFSICTWFTRKTLMGKQTFILHLFSCKLSFFIYFLHDEETKRKCSLEWLGAANKTTYWSNLNHLYKDFFKALRWPGTFLRGNRLTGRPGFTTPGGPGFPGSPANPSGPTTPGTPWNKKPFSKKRFKLNLTDWSKWTDLLSLGADHADGPSSTLENG